MPEQNCDCHEAVTSLPVRGLTIDFDTAGLVDEDLLRGLIREEMQGVPGNVIIPDFRIGVETLYPGRVNGRQMYAQMIDFGQLPNKANKTIEHGIPDIEWISVSDDLSRVTYTDGTYRPLGLSAISDNPWYYHYTETTLTMTTGKDRRAFTAVFCVLYTKTTDPVIG